MKKLSEKFKNTPRDTPLVFCSVNLQLNKEETLSVEDIVRTDNNPEVALLQQHTGEQNLRVSVKVYVLNKRGEPLMPCSPRRARVLVRNSLAKVVKRLPFTIRLCYSTGETIQDVKLGVDTGFQFVGASAIDAKKELFSAELELRTNITKLLAEKKMYRKDKKNRNHWYRKPRWKNKVSNKKKGWLAPSVQHKIDSHIRFIDTVAKLLPISKIVLETAKFDTQKINNPRIEGKEYQEGSQKDFWNVREYVLDRDSHSCQHCKKKNVVLNVHHIESRKTGGNRPDNLITLCKKCHKDFHDGKIELKIEKKRSFKAETCMSIIRKKLIEKLKERYVVEETFGYITKSKRIELKLEKTHFNDAFAIVGGATQDRCETFNIKQKRRNNRCLQINRKGFKPAVRRQRYKIQPFDLLWIKGKKYVSKGTHKYGKRIYCLDKIGNELECSTKIIEKIFNISGLIWKINTMGEKNGRY